MRYLTAFSLLMASATVALAAEGLEIVAKLDQAPGNITVTPDGRVIVSLMQFFEPKHAVAELDRDGNLVPFPNDKWTDRSATDRLVLDTVLGIQCDTQGVVWMLDNGMRGKRTPKLVGWDTRFNRLFQVIHLPPPATVKGSFLNDLAVDSTNQVVYIADPAGGADAALIVVDLRTGHARRVLGGDKSVVPENVDVVVEDKALEGAGPDGKKAKLRVGVNPIALDAFNQYLYFGPMTGTSLYRVRTSDLLDERLPAKELARFVERYCDKPVCDGISIDLSGNIYVTDVGKNAIGVIDMDRKYRILVKHDTLLSWPDAFSFGPDGMLFTVANQLHRSPPMAGGKSAAKPPFHIVRIQPMAMGVIGR